MGKKGRKKGTLESCASGVQAEKMTAIDVKSSSEFPSNKGKERNRLVHAALIPSSSIHTIELPGSETKGSLSGFYLRGEDIMPLTECNRSKSCTCTLFL